MPTAQRAVATLTVTWGLVSVPVKLYSATENNGTKAHQAHVHADGREAGRIRYERVCTVCEAEVPFADIAKAFDTDNGPVILTDEDMKSLPLNSMKAIEVQEFVAIDQIDPIMFESTYYLAPAVAAAKGAYALLRNGIANEGVVGIVKVTLRSREQIAMLHVRDGGVGPVLALTTLRWADEVRSLNVPLMSGLPEPTEQGLGVATMLIKDMTSDKFNPDAYTDGYRVALDALIESRSTGVTPEPVVTAPQGGSADLIALLQASIAANKAKAAA